MVASSVLITTSGSPNMGICENRQIITAQMLPFGGEGEREVLKKTF